MSSEEIRIDSTGIFEGMSDERLLLAYNEICGTTHESLPVEREQAIERLLKVLAVRGPAPKKAKKKARKKRKRKSNDPPGKPGRPHVPFNIPPKPPTRLPRINTRRATILNMCRNGTTAEACMEATGKDLKTTYNDIRLLSELGYGIREDENGNIEAYS